MKNKFKQFLDNYRIWYGKKNEPYRKYEKGDFVYGLFFMLRRAIPTLLFFIVFVMIILSL